MLRWQELTKQQQEQIGNGCGPAKLFNVPQFIFETSCRQHDFYYMRGGSEFDRKVADTFFYAYMLKDIQKHHNNRLLFRILAYIYFCAVRLFGWVVFHHGEYRTRQEILTYVHTSKITT